jgi:hypothetical protein
MIEPDRIEYIKKNMLCTSPYDLAMDMFSSCLTQELDDATEVALEIFSEYHNKDSVLDDVQEAYQDHYTMFHE